MGKRHGKPSKVKQVKIWKFYNQKEREDDQSDFILRFGFGFYLFTFDWLIDWFVC